MIGSQVRHFHFPVIPCCLQISEPHDPVPKKFTFAKIPGGQEKSNESAVKVDRGSPVVLGESDLDSASEESDSDFWSAELSIYRVGK